MSKTTRSAARQVVRGASAANVLRVQAGQAERDTDMLAEEWPIALEFNGVTHAVMLASPCDLEVFALGFALSEGIIDQEAQCYGIEVVVAPAGWTVRVNIATSCFARLKEKRRNLTGRTGCGLCGAESLQHVMRPLPDLTASVQRVSGKSIDLALQNLRAHQVMQQATGATHAAAWFDASGKLRLLREDVGRHNALDKVIGAGVRGGDPDWQQGMLLVTSRASMEMVQKTAVAGFPVLVAISAPTRLAVQIANDHGVCLIGFAKPGRWTIYSHPQRVPGLTSQ